MTDLASSLPAPGARGRGASAHPYAVPLMAATGAGCAALLAGHPATLTSAQAAMAVGVILLGLAPLLAYLWGGATEPFPLLALNGVFYAITFGLAAFYPRLDWLESNSPSVSAALALTLGGVALQYAGYWSFGLLFDGPRPVRIPAAAPARRLRVWAWIFFAAHLAHQLVPRIAELPSLRHVLYPLGWLAIGLLYLQCLRGDLPRWQRAAFLGVAMPLEVVTRWITGALYEVVLLFVFLGLVHWRLRRRVSFVALAVVGALFMLANPVKQQYRWLLRGPLHHADAITKAEAFAVLVIDRYRYRGEAAADEAASTSVNRAAQVSVLAHVVELTPAAVPYWRGETYGFFLSSLVPRALWPRKPEAGYGNEFGRRYFLVFPDNLDTTVNLPWLVEFYVNFGTTGVFLGMTLVGLALRFVTRKLGGSDRNDCEYVLGVSLLFQLFFAESNLALMWGALLLSSLALYAVLLVASRIDPW